MTASLNEYIQVLIHRIDGDENIWTDVEGMGYGWLWLNKEEHTWYKMMFKHIKYVLSFSDLNKNNIFYTKVVENGLTKYYIIDREQNFRDIEISLSNKELYY